MIQLNPGEQLLTTERRHWLPIALESISFLAAAIFPFFVLIGAEFLPAEATEMVVTYRSLAWFLYAVWLMGLWMFFAVSITNYYLDVLIVTNRRIIDIEQIGLFSRDTAELHLDTIEDMHVEIKGLIASFFNYGNLQIQTSSESPEFLMNNVCDPHRVQEIISKARMALAGIETAQPATPPVKKA
jgi:hypothetical protein